MAYFESVCLKGGVWTYLKESRSHCVLVRKFLPHPTPFRLLACYGSEGVWHLDLRARRRSAGCPCGRHRSTAVHSSYGRTIADVPIAGTRVLIQLQVRRFFCRHAACLRPMFAERFPTLVAVRGRHSLGVCAALRQVGLAVGGRAGARLVRTLGIPGSYRTIVRLVHRAPFRRGQPLVAPFTPSRRRRWNAGCRNAQQLWRELVAQGHQPARRTVERYVGQRRRETGTRFKFRQAAPAPLYAEDQDECRPSPLTARRAARLFLSKPEEHRPTERSLFAHLLRLDPVMSDTYHQVQAFCRMVRQRHSDDFDAWITDVQQSGVKERRAFAKGLLTDAAAVRAGRSRIWSNGPTEGFIHRLKLIKRQAYGRAGVDFLRHRILPSSAGRAA